MILTSSVNNPALFFDDKLSFKTYFFGFVAMLTLASNNVAIPATSTSFSTGTFLSQCRTIKPSFLEVHFLISFLNFEHQFFHH